MISYQQQIANLLECALADARLVESFMRLESGTLDNLSPAKFKNEAKVCWICVKEDRKGAVELAKTCGL